MLNLMSWKSFPTSNKERLYFYNDDLSLGKGRKQLRRKDGEYVTVSIENTGTTHHRKYNDVSPGIFDDKLPFSSNSSQVKL